MFGFCVLFVGGCLLVTALVRIPLTSMNKRILLCLLAGVMPAVFLRSELLFRYFGTWLTLAGTGGIVWLIADRLEPVFGYSSFIHGGNNLVFAAGAFYLFLLMIGLLILRHVRKRASRPVT
jgi:hypothetical protein